MRERRNSNAISRNGSLDDIDDNLSGIDRDKFSCLGSHDTYIHI